MNNKSDVATEASVATTSSPGFVAGLARLGWLKAEILFSACLVATAAIQTMVMVQQTMISAKLEKLELARSNVRFGFQSKLAPDEILPLPSTIDAVVLSGTGNITSLEARLVGPSYDYEIGKRCMISAEIYDTENSNRLKLSEEFISEMNSFNRKYQKINTNKNYRVYDIITPKVGLPHRPYIYDGFFVVVKLQYNDVFDRRGEKYFIIDRFGYKPISLDDFNQTNSYIKQWVGMDIMEEDMTIPEKLASQKNACKVRPKLPDFG